MKKLILIIVGLVAIITSMASISCASSSKSAPQTVRPPMTTTSPAYSYPSSSQQGNADYGGIVPTQTSIASVPSMPFPSATPAINQPGTSTERMVVRSGNIELVVSDVAAALDNITRLAADAGGYVVTSQKWKEGERNIGSISVRVLAENYDKTILALRQLAKSVTSESTSSQDVTEEYVDLESKVKTLEASEAQLLKIMETATKTEDVISIQRELTNVRGQIEQAKGRMQYLQRTSTTSLIQIRLNEAMLDLKFSADKVRVDSDEQIRFNSEVAGGFEPYNYLWDFGDRETSVEKSPAHSYAKAGVYYVSLKVTDDKGYTKSVTRSEYINVIGGWNAGNIARDAWSGFAAFGRGLTNVLIYLGIFSPVWIVIGGIVWLIIYKNKKKKKV